jgi:protein-tyrosine phosphatase
MFKRLIAFQMLLCAYLSANPPAHALDQLCVSEQCATKAHFDSIKEQFDARWQVFQKSQHFKLFSLGKSDADLREEFENIQKTRKDVWSSPGYELAHYLISADLIRAPGCVSFAYNNTVPYYNASTMCLSGTWFIACEGPRSKDVPAFFKLLTSHHVTHLVRLTDAYEGETKKCHPYWEGLLTEVQGKSYLCIPQEDGVYSLRAFEMSYWKDHRGVEPEQLLACVLQVKQELAETGGLLVVHCSAGVGRTGTFLAALAIVEALDRNEPFSIEEIVYRLSLQRVHSVAQTMQYVTLYRLAELYLKEKNIS